MQEGSDDEIDLGYDDEESEDEDNEFSQVQVGYLEVEEYSLDISTSAAVWQFFIIFEKIVRER